MEGYNKSITDRGDYRETVDRVMDIVSSMNDIYNDLPF